MTRVAVVDSGIREGFSMILRQRVPGGWEVVSDPAGATVLVTESVHIGSAMLARAGSGVRLVAQLDTGTARLEVGSIATIRLSNAALVGVAEHTVALILASLRGLVDLDRRTRARAYLPDRSEPKLTNQTDYTYNWIGLSDFGTLYGRAVGLVGLGYIGRATAERLRTFGARLFYTQRTRLPRDVEEALGVQYLTLDELLARCDVVSLHHRFHDGDGGNDASFGAEAFAAMKPGAVFVNTARGRLVDEDALASALRSGHIGAAALDVFRVEPLSEGHPFFSIPSERLLLTPHMAGGPIDEAWGIMADAIVERTQTLLGNDDA